MSSVLFDPLTHEIADAQAFASPETRPHPASYDSGEECSLSHLAHVYELVDIEKVLDHCALDAQRLPAR